MRPWFAALVLAACSSAPAPRASGVPDDLELEPALERRDPEAAPVAAPAADAAAPAVRVEVVEEAQPGAPDGPRIDLAVRDADVTDVLRMIAAAAKIGLVVAD